MGGGLLQLVAYGAQDVYLTGNPQITFFKVVYRRHTNFAMEAIQQTFSGIASYGNTVTCQISRNGDLINRAYLQVDLPTLSGSDKYVNYLGLRLLKSVTIEIGGQQIDKHYSDWLYIWNELSLPRGKRAAWELMVGADQDLITSTATSLYIPLEFWFCRNIGLALPLIALQYHEVKLKIEFEAQNNCIYQLSGTSTIPSSDEDATVSLSLLELYNCFKAYILDAVLLLLLPIPPQATVASDEVYPLSRKNRTFFNGSLCLSSSSCTHNCRLYVVVESFS